MPSLGLLYSRVSHSMKFSIFYLAFVFLICIYVMNFSEWLKIDEAKVDPKLFDAQHGFDG